MLVRALNLQLSGVVSALHPADRSSGSPMLSRASR
jgi:hypothetical protein